MKILNTLQELWSECLYCPLCRDVCREVELISDSKNISINSCTKIDNNIKFSCIYSPQTRKNFVIVYNINCKNNSYEVICNTLPLDDIPEISFQLIGTCTKCLNTFAISSSFATNRADNTIYNIGIDKENVLLSSDKNNYSITLLHYSESMLISKCNIEEGEHSAVSFPIMKFDFSHPKTVIKKIKTLLLFS